MTPPRAPLWLRTAYLVTAPVEYVPEGHKRRQEARRARTCIRSHPEGCRCWKAAEPARRVV